MAEKQIVYTPSLFQVDEGFTDERFLRARICAMHSKLNRNNSYFSLDVIKSAKDTFANIPVLANVVEYTDKDGNKHLDYGSHDFHIEDDKFHEDEQRIIYDEKVVGIIPETNDFEIIENKERGVHEVWLTALLYRDYGNYVCDILEERGGTTDVSMEILCEDISYNAKEKYVEVGKMTASGVTLLGADVQPGMQGAHAEVFSLNEDSKHEQLIRIMQELKESLDNYTATIAEQYSEKGGKTVAKKQFDEAITTEEEVKVEETAEEIVETPSEEEATEEVLEEENETVVEETVAEETETEAEPVVETAEEESPVAESLADLLKLSVTVNGETREFSMSLRDKMSALYSLVNDTYSEVDNAWYDVEVFEDPDCVVMQDWFSGRAYKQSYSQNENSFALEGERVEVYAEWVTTEEQSKLDNMRANYDAIAERLAKYEAEPEKVAILNSDEYANLEGVETFESLKEQANHFDLSVDDLKSKLDTMLLEYAKGHKVEFAQTVRKVGHKTIAPTMPKSDGKGKYGGVFNRKK